MPRVAVVGAGLAGLACARRLADHGVDVTILDKGRSVGGRLAARPVPPHLFDLGAQYFTVRDGRFRRQVRFWLAAGACAPWRGRIAAVDGTGDAPRRVDPIERLVGTPDMNALARHLAIDLRVRTGQRVQSIARGRGGELVLRGSVAPSGVTPGPPARKALAQEDLDSCDYAVLCLPASQAAPLLDPVSPRLAEEARAVPFEPCLAVGLVGDQRDLEALRALDFDGAFVGREGAPSWTPSAWVARDSSKPGRPPGSAGCFTPRRPGRARRPTGPRPA